MGRIGQGNTAFDFTAATRRLAPRAALAGLLASAILASQGALAQHRVETAMVPAGAIPPERGAGLPRILGARDIDTYRQVFILQRATDWAGADRLLARVEDRRLVGHALADRFLHIRYKSNFPELAEWLRQFADHPDAGAIFRLAERRAPKGASLRKPVEVALPDEEFAEDLGLVFQRLPTDRTTLQGRRLSGEGSTAVSAVAGAVEQTLRAGDLETAERLLRQRGGDDMSAPEQDQLKTALAAAWFSRGQDAKAIELAGEAASRSGQTIARAHWITGLALFRQGKYRQAAAHFEAVARQTHGHPWDIAAGAFWASRAHLRDRKPDRVNYWRRLAAEHPRTFYGMLAARTLGLNSTFNWEIPSLSATESDALRRTPAAARALALVEIGEDQRAEAELRRLYATSGPNQTRVLLAVAMRANMPALALRLGHDLADLDGRRHDAALFPVPHWQPQSGFQVEPALVYALMRQESGFNPKAVSRAGASGLMQLMPATAAVMDDTRKKLPADKLLDPATNMELGQRYIRHLLDQDVVQGDLIRLAAAYNGGPGNLSRWQRAGEAQADALLYIEALPAAETRQFITRVLVNYWMYAERLGQPAPSLDAIARGEWPAYGGESGDLDSPATRHARN